MLTLSSNGYKVQKSTLPTLFNFAGVRAAHQPHVGNKVFAHDMSLASQPNIYTLDTICRISVGEVPTWRTEQ